ncbi:MAG: hypothetical protein KC434_00445 [Anaerolineales bacterium]|nr:hypothetical protein [Anaerolineales bacterium]
MFPEDRVLVAYVPQPADFEIIQTENWYRIPQKQAPKGLHAEYFAFYFGRRFGPEKWAIHYYAPQLGHELTTRLALFPDQPDHPRAQEMYYKVQLGPLQKLPQPIVSLRWRRVTFIHTTWDRFMDASEINDLFVDGEPYVDRLYATLKERGIQAERNYLVRESGSGYWLPLVVWCRNGRIDLTHDQLTQQQNDLDKLVARIAEQVAQYGGLASPLDASGKM